MERIYWFTPFMFSMGALLWILGNYKNEIIGYRTPRSLKSVRNWKYANRLAGILCMIFSVVWSLTQLILSEYTDFTLYGGNGAVLMICGFAFIIFIIEKD